MPIARIPIVHKFGIISQSQRIELQERLLRQSSTSAQSNNVPVASKYPLEVTDEFVNQYNHAINLNEIEKLEATAQKMLARAKRRVGLKDSGKGMHVDLPYAWTELSQLAQCRGQIQEDCLDVLITSLDQSPMTRSQIPALFFLAETCLYWLRTDAVREQYLRSAELKILETGYLTFARLFYHHMAGQLQKHHEFKNRLFTYLDGFQDCQEAYNPYPNALLCIRYISEVGKMIIGAAGGVDPGEVKEGDPKGRRRGRDETVSESSSSNEDEEVIRHAKIEDSVEEVSGYDMEEGKESRLSLDEYRNPLHRSSIIKRLFREVSMHYNDDDSGGSKSGGTGGQAGGGGLSSSVHDLSPTLWHALDVWRCTHQLSGGLTDALHALACCGSGLAAETWVDGICALHILTDAAKVNLSTLRVLQDLARGLPAPQSSSAHHKHKGASALRRGNASRTTGATITPGNTGEPGLSDIYEKTEEGSSEPFVDSRLQHHDEQEEDEEEIELPPTAQEEEQVKADVDLFSPPLPPVRSPVRIVSDISSPRIQYSDLDLYLDTRSKNASLTPGFTTPVHESSLANPALQMHVSHDSVFTPPTLTVPPIVSDHSLSPKKCKSERGPRPPVTAGGLQTEKTSSTFDPYATAGYSRDTTGWKAEVGSADRLSTASTVPTYTNEVDERLAGLQGWHWEVAVTYTDLLADIVMHGSSSNIQKVALVGNGGSTGERKQPPSCPMRSAGLIDLVSFTAVNETLDGTHNDWSWRVRYTALLALVRLFQGTKGDVAREGMHNLAYTTLQAAYSKERDKRVLEALRVGQVDCSLGHLLAQQMQQTHYAVGSRIAAGLAKLYLPSLPPPVPEPKVRKHPPSNKSAPWKLTKPPPPKQPLRTTLKEEIDLASALYEPPIPFNAKTNYDLKRIVEDQFRKELQQQLEDEEAERMQQLKEKQKENELAERLAKDLQMSKMQKRYKGKAGVGKSVLSPMSPKPRTLPPVNVK